MNTSRRANRFTCCVTLVFAGALVVSACHSSTVRELQLEEDEDVFVSPYAISEDEAEDPMVGAAEAGRRREAVARGQELFREACATCHGVAGNGQGPSGAALEPRPRDFTLGLYKWRSTESGSLPLDSDIFRTITRGVPGTMMVAWGDLLSERERWDLVEYLKTFTTRFEEEGVEDDEIVEIPIPVLPTRESVARGKEIYAAAKCGECHGDSGRGDGPSAPTLEDSWGRSIRPFDFTVGQYRCGTSDRAIYRTFFTGLNGTPMPGFAETVAEEDRWPLVHYVRSLQRQPGFFERLVFEFP